MTNSKVDFMNESPAQVTILVVPGPNTSIKYLHGKRVPGGWDYALANLDALDQMNSGSIKKVVVGHLDEWGPAPTLSKTYSFSVTIKTFESQKFDHDNPSGPSLQHGYLLNALMADSQIDSRFLAVLDPDCYLVSPGVISRLISYISTSGISAFGVSYPPGRFNYQDYPTPIFSIFDLGRLGTLELDFRPPESFSSPSRAQAKNLGPKLFRSLRKSFFDFGRHFLILLVSIAPRLTPLFFAYEQIRHSISTRRLQSIQHDTGWNIREALIEKSIPFEVAKSVFPSLNLQIGFDEAAYTQANPDVMQSNFNPTWHFLVFGLFQNRSIGKQRFLFNVLKRRFGPRHSIPSAIFDARHMENANPMVSPSMFSFWRNFVHSDQYNWQNKPFAIHLSSYGKNKDGKDKERIDRLIREAVLKTPSGG